ncbi:flagellar biosynthesis protein R [Breoghania sp.]|uniref:flagellar biosynthesis protein R n=1 Tax=Breoghania sp. TaxID=2065378 RepID=UPI0029C9D594|nr:flagellar biosynthesis protein R [Breoghania sp.]
MSKRVDQINRILKLQDQLHRLSEWVLISLDQKNRTLMKDQERVLTSLSGGDLALHDRFIRNASRRLKTIASEQSRILETRQNVQAGLQRQERMMEVTRRQLGQMEREENACEEKRQLEIVLDAMLLGGEASLTQAPERTVRTRQDANREP